MKAIDPLRPVPFMTLLLLAAACALAFIAFMEFKQDHDLSALDLLLAAAISLSGSILGFDIWRKGG